MRFKSQALQNLPLTGIKASNLINSVARRGRWRPVAICCASSTERKRRKRSRRRRRLTVSLNCPAVTIGNINAVCSAFLKRPPYSLWAYSTYTQASSAIMGLALVITRFTISDVTSKQQQPCHNSPYSSMALQYRGLLKLHVVLLLVTNSINGIRL